MGLSSYTDYALRMLMYLAVRQEGTPTISEIAQVYGISKNHRMQHGVDARPSAVSHFPYRRTGAEGTASPTSVPTMPARRRARPSSMCSRTRRRAWG
ncbi:hypothetical protein HLK65_30575 [Azospirillum formosense]|nr:hypothetical protein [Azospirillum formosense]